MSSMMNWQMKRSMGLSWLMTFVVVCGLLCFIAAYDGGFWAAVWLHCMSDSQSNHCVNMWYQCLLSPGLNHRIAVIRLLHLKLLYRAFKVALSISLSTHLRWIPTMLIVHCLTSPPTQYRLSGRQFYRSKDPTNSIKVQSTEGKNATKVKKTWKKQTTQNTAAIQ